jgi:Protein phosphatase 2C
MTPSEQKPRWRVIGDSCRGASHVKSGLPNQDALGFWLPESGQGPPAILAIADGHGSPQHFRSATGAQLAVQAAMSLLLGFAKIHGSQRNPAEVQAAAAELPQRLVENWTASVSAHLAANPFREDDFTHLGDGAEADARLEVGQNPLVAYGATLLAILITDSCLLCMQVGDGDILRVDDAGNTTRPIPADPRLIANQTTSLCQPEAWRDFRVYVEYPLRTAPALMMASTDGYANSFRSDEDFLQIGNDFLAIAREGGLPKIAAQLPGILRDASEKGSGDDVTFGIMRRLDSEEEAMPDYVPKTEWESARGRLEAQLSSVERRLSLLQWGLIFALIIAVVSLAAGFAQFMGARGGATSPLIPGPGAAVPKEPKPSPPPTANAPKTSTSAPVDSQKKPGGGN